MKKIEFIEFSDEEKRIEFDSFVMSHENDRHQSIEAMIDVLAD